MSVSTLSSSNSVTESGCLSRAATINMTNVRRDELGGVEINGALFNFAPPLAEGWTTTDLVIAVNTQQPILDQDTQEAFSVAGEVYSEIFFLYTDGTNQFYEFGTVGQRTPVEIVKTLDNDTGIEEVRVFSSDGETEYVLPPENGLVLSVGDCPPATPQYGNVQTSIAYIEECDPFDIVLPIDQEGTFSANIAPTVNITSEAATIALIASQIQEAQEYQQAEELNALPVTNFVITTLGGNTYEFPPNSLVTQSSNTLEFDQAQVVSWPGPETDDIAIIAYSIFSNCACRPVELSQYIREDGTGRLLKILDPRNTDFVTGEKPEIPIPPPFGTNGPFPGPCPEAEQVLELDPLCCNDDLLANNQDIANQRFAWMDNSMPNLMLNNGLPIAGNEGDLVDEVQDRLNPGVGPSILFDPAVGSEGTLNLDSINALPTLFFDGVDDRASIENAGRANGTAFTIFMLVRVDGGAAAFAQPISGSKLVAPFDNLGEWTLSRGSGAFLGDLIFSYTTSPVTSINETVMPWDEFANGQLRLITIEYTGNTDNLFRCYIDGFLYADLDSTGFDVTSQSINIMRNRANFSFVEGNVSEVLATNLLDQKQISTVNAYLICKWGIDPSLSAGGAGDLTLAEDGAYSSPTPFRRILRASGEVVYLNSVNGLEFPVPPVPGLSVCEGESGSTTTYIGDVCYESDEIEEETVGATNWQLGADPEDELIAEFVFSNGDVVNMTFEEGIGDDHDMSLGTACGSPHSDDGLNLSQQQPLQTNTWLLALDDDVQVLEIRAFDVNPGLGETIVVQNATAVVEPGAGADSTYTIDNGLSGITGTAVDFTVECAAIQVFATRRTPVAKKAAVLYDGVECTYFDRETCQQLDSPVIVDCPANEVINNPVTTTVQPGMINIDGAGQWINPPNTISVNILVRNVADIGNPPTATINGVPYEIFQGDALPWGSPDYSVMGSGDIIVDSNAGDYVTVIFMEK